MLSWLKGLPIGHYVIMACIVVASLFWSDYQNTKHQLEQQTELTQQWQNAAETLRDIGKRDTIIIRAGQEAEHAIQEAPNAQTIVPSDIAIPWAAGIDSVRDAGTKPADSEYELPGPSRGEAERTEFDVRGASTILDQSGAGFLEV